MKGRTLIAGAGVAVLALVAVSYALVKRAPAAEAPGGKPGTRGVELTVYSQDFALIHEKRGVALAKGPNRLVFADVSRELDPHSVLLRWGGDAPGDAAEIVGHSYDLGVADSQSLLKLETGNPVEIVRYGENGKEASRERGRLLVAEEGRPAVVEVGGKLYVNPEGTLVVDAHEGVPTIPQLTVQAESPAARAASMELAYLTRGLRWSADYVATLSGDADDRLDLECYATVTNRTGVRYPNAAVTLVAGAPSRAVVAANARVMAGAPPAAMPRRAEAPVDSEPRWAAVAAPEGVADLYAYPLKSAATIQNEQLNRLLMLRREGVKVHKTYSYRAPYLECYGAPQQERGTVTAALWFLNNPQEGVGAPLPRGAIRIYDPDRSGRLRYAGAAEIPSTPKNRKVAFTLSNAFDVIADYRTVSSKKVGRNKIRRQVEVLLRNERAQAVQVRVAQGFYGTWNVVAASRRHQKINGGTAQWTLDVPAGGETKLTYAVDLGW
jgi:hypothetical protein